MPVAIGLAFDKGRGVDITGGLFDLSLANGRLAEPNIIADSARKEKDILLYDAYAPAQLFDMPLPHVEAVDENGPLLNVVETANEAYNSGLARTGGTD